MIKINTERLERNTKERTFHTQMAVVSSLENGFRYPWPLVSISCVVPAHTIPGLFSDTNTIL